jgi:hypothetical protein
MSHRKALAVAKVRIFPYTRMPEVQQKYGKECTHYLLGEKPFVHCFDWRRAVLEAMKNGCDGLLAAIDSFAYVEIHRADDGYDFVVLNDLKGNSNPPWGLLTAKNLSSEAVVTDDSWWCLESELEDWDEKMLVALTTSQRQLVIRDDGRVAILAGPVLSKKQPKRREKEAAVALPA